MSVYGARNGARITTMASSSKQFSQQSPLDRLDLLDSFVLSGVLTVLVVRGGLYLTGFPAIGGDSLHIAHVLWGGLFLVVAFLILLLGRKPNKLLTAVLGGIGFGLFIDEIGKFITKDNDYFYRPAFVLMYLSFLAIWFLSRLVLVRMSDQKFLSPAEWPKSELMVRAIVYWARLQIISGVLLLLVGIVTDFSRISDFLGISGIGVIAGLGYVLMLAKGVRQYRLGDVIPAAHTIRGASIVSILLLFPFIFIEYPIIGIVGVIITVPVIVGLSQVTLKELLWNLVYAHRSRS